jgi:hypothetical protein
MGTPDNNETRADVLLREALVVMAPLARLLVTNGVPYPVFAQALKSVFLNAAQQELQREGKRITDSALSLLSGVHRKDVRAMTAPQAAPALPRAASMASEVCARWRYDPTWQDALGVPLQLPVRASGDSAPSFERLAQSVSKDFHARSVLDELLRLGVAEVRGETVLLKHDEFIPSNSFAETVRLSAANMHDLAASVEANLEAIDAGRSGPFVENSVLADEISEESARNLNQLARTLWLAAVRKTVRAATEAVEADRALPAGQRNHRFRFGGYSYFASEAGHSAGVAEVDPAARDDQ